jgi:hypothetical protein
MEGDTGKKLYTRKFVKSLANNSGLLPMVSVLDIG